LQTLGRRAIEQVNCRHHCLPPIHGRHSSMAAALRELPAPTTLHSLPRLG
jgi:hypothetical protein